MNAYDRQFLTLDVSLREAGFILKALSALTVLRPFDELDAFYRETREAIENATQYTAPQLIDAYEKADYSLLLKEGETIIIVTRIQWNVLLAKWRKGEASPDEIRALMYYVYLAETDEPMHSLTLAEQDIYWRFYDDFGPC